MASLGGAATLWVLPLTLHEASVLVASSASARVFGFLPSPRSIIPGAASPTGMLVVLGR